MVPLAQLQGMPAQPRQTLREDESLYALARSIAAEGILQPLVAAADIERPGRYILIAGHRRLAACRLLERREVELVLDKAKKDEENEEKARRSQEVARAAAAHKVSSVPVVLRDVNPAEAFALALVENLQRDDLSRREVMDAVTKLRDQYHWSTREIARRTGRDEDLSRLMRIADDPDVSALVTEEIISATAAGYLIETPVLSIREPVLAAIRAGQLRTTGDIQGALAAERAKHTRPAQPPAVTQEEMSEAPHMPPSAAPLPTDDRSAEDSQGQDGAAALSVTTVSGQGGKEPSIVATDKTESEQPLPTSAGSITEADPPALRREPSGATRTIDVTQHTRRIRSDGQSGAAIDVVEVQGMLRDIITYVPRGTILSPGLRGQIQATIDHLSAVLREELRP